MFYNNYVTTLQVVKKQKIWNMFIWPRSRRDTSQSMILGFIVYEHVEHVEAIFIPLEPPNTGWNIYIHQIFALYPEG